VGGGTVTVCGLGIAVVLRGVRWIPAAQIESAVVATGISANKSRRDFQRDAIAGERFGRADIQGKKVPGTGWDCAPAEIENDLEGARAYWTLALVVVGLYTLCGLPAAWRGFRI
jgi:hypothetical protein